MKHLMTAALAALALMGGTSALAAPGGLQRPSRGGGGGQGAGPRRPSAAKVGGHAAAMPAALLEAARRLPAAHLQRAPPRRFGRRIQVARAAAPAYQGTPGARPAATHFPGRRRLSTAAGPNGAYVRGGPAAARRRNASDARRLPRLFADRAAAAHAAARSRRRPAQRRSSRGGVRAAYPSNYSPRFGAPGFRPGQGAARPHYDAQYFPRVFQPEHRYAWRGQPWISQPGYYYRHWAYGDRLPFGWFTDRWIINDYYYYDLAVPPYGYEWIRVGPDALLVDLDDGTVVESVYGLFY